MQSWTFDSPDPERTREMGAALGRSIGREGLILALIGPLGAGKTVFVKGLAEGLGVDSRLVSSPTFVIAQEYPLAREADGVGPKTLHHIDLYRLESEDELEAIGFFDMLAPGNVLAVEWADRFAGVLGRKLLTIELEGPSASESSTEGESGPGPVRRARLTATGDAAERVLADFAARAEATPESAVSAGGRSSGRGRAATPEMRLLHMLGMSLAGLVFLGLGSARFESFAESVRTDLLGHSVGCGIDREWVELERDVLGTLSVTCASRGASTSGDQRSLSGIGRLVSGERIDLESATSALLQTLPGIGPKRAEAILTLRDRGVLRLSRDLERVSGIGPKTRSRLEKWVETPRTAQEIQGG